MNGESHAMDRAALGSQKVAAASLSATRPFYWSVRRELWENRSIYLAPLGAAVLFLLGFLITLVHLPAKMRGLSAMDQAHYHEAIALPYDIAAGLMMLIGIIVSVFYCADALHGERRDRSILFWKSLPVSDFTAVMAKAAVPLVIVPLLTFSIAVAMQIIMLLMSSAVLLANGMSIATLWTQLSLLQMILLMLYHIVTAHAIWPAPIYAWILLVSGWARRAVLLWAVLPIIAISGLEAIVFRTSHFAATVGSHLIGDTPAIVAAPSEMFPTNPMVHLSPGRFLTSPGLWVGLLLTAAFIAAAVRMRRCRGPI